MKTFIFLFCTTVFALNPSNVISQNSKIKIDTDKTISVDQAFDLIMEQTDYNFFYEEELFKGFSKIFVRKGTVKADKLLKRILSQGDFNIEVSVDKVITIKKKTPNITKEKEQQIQVSGIIKDASGEPLPGASILEKGTTNGTETDFDGNFSLTVSDENATLVVSYIGYTIQEVALNGKTSLEVTLQEDAAKLDEIVVVGYGTQSKRKVTGSVSSINVTKTEKAGFLSTDDVLQGRISGVQIAATSGAPGGQQRINVRGIGSLQGDNLPLVVIDGIPINNSDPSGVNGTKYGFSAVNNQSPLALLNPNDIASIDVLKDASSTAIYGSRGTNGVIIITTKKGKTGQAKVSLNTYTGIQHAPEKIETANTVLWLELNNEARSNFNSDKGLSSGDSGYLAPLSNPLASGQTEFDWIGALTNSTSIIQDHGISITGGNDKTKYFASLGYFDQEGWFKTSRFKRYSNKLNLEHRFNDKIKFGANLIANYSINNRVASHGSGTRLLSRALEQRPADPAYHPDGSYNIGGSSTLRRHSGVQVINEQTSAYKTYRGIFNFFTEFKPFEGFTYKPSFNIDYGTYHDNTYTSPDHVRSGKTGGKGRILDSRNILTNLLVENLFEYQKSWEDFDFKALVGHSFQKETVESSLIDARLFPSPSFTAISSAALQFAFGEKLESTLDSYLGRITGSYKDRYFLNIALRRDGSSRFADNKRYGNFPSASIGWVATEEPFFKEESAISFLKLRASYGVTGSTSSIGRYSSLALVSGGSDYLGNSGLTANQVANPNLTWEQAKSYNYGLDLHLFDSRVKLTMDYYTRDTDNLLYDRPVHGTTGFSTFSENIGSLTNKGFEFGLNADIIANDDFSWNFGLNLSTTSNELTSLIGDEPIPLGYNVLKTGESIGSFYLLKQIGIYQSDSEVPAKLAAKGVRAGDVIYEDISGDGDITPEDRQIVGNAFPNLFGGINNTFKYKNFDLSIFANFSSGNDIYAAWRSGGYLSGGPSGSIRVGGGVDGLGYSDFGALKETVQNRWTGPGTSNTIPRAISRGTGAATHNSQASSRWVEDASFIRIRNITLGYTLPKEMIDNLPVDNLRIYLTGNNLFTFTKYSGYAPEASDSSDPRTFGADFLTSPALRTIILGLNLNF